MSISLKRYDGAIVKPKDDRILLDGIFDDYGLMDGGSAAMSAFNQIHVGAARLFVRGSEVIIEDEDISVRLSDAGAENGRLKIVVDYSDAEHPVKFESEVSSNLPELVQDKDVNYKNGRYEVEFARYKATESSISDVVMTVPKMEMIKDRVNGIDPAFSKTLPTRNQYKDFLQINPNDRNDPAHEVLYFGADSPGVVFVNSPVTDTPFYGYRVVRWNSPAGANGHLITVELHEQYPVAGRVWANTYDKGNSQWIGWRCETETLKKSVSDGKKTVAEVITAKGVPTAAAASFSTIAANIRKACNNIIDKGTLSFAYRVRGGSSTATPYFYDKNYFYWNGSSLHLESGGTYFFVSDGYNLSGNIYIHNTSGAVVNTINVNDVSNWNGGRNITLSKGQYITVNLSATSAAGSGGIVTCNKVA